MSNKNSDFNKKIEKYKKDILIGSKKKTIILASIIGSCVVIGGLVGGHFIYKGTHPVIPDYNICTIKFDTKGREKLDDIQVKKGDTLERPTYPTSEKDFTFDDWYLDKDYKLKCEFPLTVTGDITLYAKWVVKYTYKLDDSSIQKEEIYEINETTKRPEDPTKEGYTFAGWYEDKTIQVNEYEFGYPAIKNTTLKAKWVDSSKEKVVTFSYGLDKFTHSVVADGQKVSKPATPTYEGYVFDDWYQDTERKTKWNFDLGVTQDITLYAKWYAFGKATVTFSYGDGKSFYFECVEIGKTISRPKDPTHIGYTFLGWCTDYERKSEFDFATQIYEDTVLFANWDKLESFVTEEEYKASFENLINIKENKDLNYQQTGTIVKKTNGNVDFSIKDLQVEKNSTKDIEYFYYDAAREYIYSQKCSYTDKSLTPFYIYVSKDFSGYAQYKYFKSLSIREQLAEMLNRLYTDYSCFTFKNDKFIYHSTGEYQIDTELTFGVDKDGNKKMTSANIKYLHTISSNKTSEVDMNVKFAYEAKTIDAPTGGDVEEHKTNRIHAMNLFDSRYVTDKIDNYYAPGDHILKMTNDSDNKFKKLRYYGADGERIYYDIPIDLTIYKNSKELVMLTDYNIEVDSETRSNIIVFTDEITKDDCIEVLINNMESHAHDTYQYEFIQ